MKPKPYVYRGVNNKAAVEELEPKPYLYRGVNNEAAVKELQTQLNLFLREKGKKIIEVDGDFGRATEAALKSFKSEILRIKKPDGKVGDFTHDMLDEHYPLPVKEKARPAEKVAKKPSAEASTQDDEPKNKSGSSWNAVSSWMIGWFNPTKKETPEAKVKDEPASEREHPVAKPTPVKSDRKQPTPATPAPVKSDRKQPAPATPAPENLVNKPAPAKPSVEDEPDSRYANLTKQLDGMPPFMLNQAAIPMKAASVVITSPFGPRDDSVHEGFDLRARKRTPIYAATDGEADTRWSTGGYGNIVTIKKGSLETKYAHLDEMLVADGQRVSEGQLIGFSGNTTGTKKKVPDHLHYEEWKNGKPRKPILYARALVPRSKEFFEFAQEAREERDALETQVAKDNIGSKYFPAAKKTVLFKPWDPLDNLTIKPKGEFSPQDAGSNGVPTEGPAATPSTNVKQKGLLNWLVGS